MPAFPTIAILAGGLGTRLGDKAKSIPKSMIEVAGEPFIAHQLRLLAREGVREAVLLTAHLENQIQDFVAEGSHFGIKVSYSSDGPIRLGTGGAIKKALPLLSDPFAVIYGDTYLDIAFRPVHECFLRLGKPALMTVLANNGLWDKSNVVFAEGMVRLYDKENPTKEMHHIDYGLSILSKSVLDEHKPEQAFAIEDVFVSLSRNNLLSGYEVNHRFYEIGKPEGLAETDRYLRSKLKSDESAVF